MKTTKNYIELHVGISTNAEWYKTLEEKIRGRSRRWIEENFHITAAFMNNDQLKDELIKAFDEVLKDRKAPKLTLDKLTVFTTRNKKDHIVHLTSSQPSEELMELVESLRNKAESVGAKIGAFRLHVTLAYIDVQEMELEEVEKILEQIPLPSFEVTIRRVEYKYWRRKNNLIDGWNLK